MGVARISLHFAASGSLKTKRAALRSLLDGLKHRFNLAAAEVEFQDLWQRSTLALATVNSERSGAESTISQAIRWVEGSGKGDVLDVATEWYG